MDISFKELFKRTLSDRPYLSVIVAIVTIAVLFTMYMVFSIESRDIQVTTRYSSFGEANYYKDKWYSLYGFALLALAIAAGHSALMLKFLALDRRDFGKLFGMLTIVVLLVGWVYAANVIGQIAFI